MVQYFVLYFGCTLLIVAIMFYRTFLLKIILAASRGGIDSRKGGKFRQKISKLVTDQVRKINEEACVFFAKQYVVSSYFDSFHMRTMLDLLVDVTTGTICQP